MLIQSPAEFIDWANFIRTQGPYLVLAIVFGWLLYKLYKQDVQTRSEQEKQAREEAARARERERAAFEESKQHIKELHDKRERDLQTYSASISKHAEDLKRVSEATTRGMEELAGSVRALAREVIEEVRKSR
jgi:hypothetical protein